MRYVGLLSGIAAGLLLVAFLTIPDRNTLVAKGPMNTGHEALGCQECHIPVKGTRAQQVSSSVYHWFGLRESSIGFGSKDVESGTCLECHERPDDRHPISRFLEPRFADVRQQLRVQDCVTCHTEHHGKRVTLSTIGFCAHCHQDTELDDDPITPNHAELAQTSSWNTCLQCHDFHGNHKMTTPHDIGDGVSEQRVWTYFDGATSPYSLEKFAEPSKTKGGGGK